jgi:sugar phosphate isomerase/epimerase
MMNRRTFLKTSAAATVGSAAITRVAWASPMSLPIGIQLYAVKIALSADPIATLKKLHEIGYREVETFSFVGKSAAEFHLLLDDAGLKCPSAHLQFKPGEPQAAFADAHALGATYAVSSALWYGVTFDNKPQQPGSDPFAAVPTTPDHFKRLAAIMNELGSAAKQSGLRYAYHNHNVEFVRMPDGSYGYDILLKETDPSTVFFEADCGWFTVAGADPVKYFQTYPGRFRMIHVKDFQPIQAPITSLRVADRPHGVELGQGFVQYQRIFDAAKKAGIEHAFAEQEAPFSHSELDSAAIDYKFLASFS